MKVLIIYPNGSSNIMNIEDVCKIYRVSKQQIFWAIKSGHHLKTLLFDEVYDEKI